MIVTAWRIVQSKRRFSAFNGQGAKQYPGRWNHRGVPMVYTAESLSLAALEILVNLNAAELLTLYSSIPVSFDIELCKKIDIDRLPKDWASNPIQFSTRDLGTAWAHSLASVVLAVPSAVVPNETNFLINPLHPDSRKLIIGRAKKFQFDPRLLKN